MTPEEKLAYNAQLGREQYQSKQVRQQQIRDRQIPSLQVQSWDTAHQAYRSTTPDGTVRYVEPLTNGAIAAGDAVRSGRNRIDGMPAPKAKPEVTPIIPVTFDFYVGFDRYITKARDTGMRSLPIKTFLSDGTLYGGIEAGFVSSKDGFIYSVGDNEDVIYKINSRTLEATAVIDIEDVYPNSFFTALCLGPDGSLFAAIRQFGISLFYKRSPDGTEQFYAPELADQINGTSWSIATLDSEILYLVVDYFDVYRFNTTSGEVFQMRGGVVDDVSESTFLFADNRHQNLYLFGLLDTPGLPRSQGIIWRIVNDDFVEHYKFRGERSDGNLERFYGLPSRSAIADAKTKTIFMLGVDTTYTNDGGFGVTISNTNKIIRIDRNKRRTDFTLKFDDPTIESRFDFFGQLDWVY